MDYALVNQLKDSVMIKCWSNIPANGIIAKEF